MTSDFVTQRPERLVDIWNARKLSDELANLDCYEEQYLAKADYMLTTWTGWVAAKRDGREVAKLQSQISRILEDPLIPEMYRHRWNAMNDILETLRLVILRGC